ncbi:MAG: HAD-IIA family hydrolase [Actinomycetota bacterium]
MRPVDGYRHVVFDLDGVLYLRDKVIATAPATVAALRREGKGIAFVTNNSWSDPEEVASRLTGMGVPARAEEVVTSAGAAADLAASRAPGARVFAIGGPGLRRALEAQGMRALDEREGADAEVVVAGLDLELTYSKLRTACLAIERGALFVGTNPDASYPTPEGKWPGAGAVLAALAAATGQHPIVAGKPARPMLELAERLLGPGSVLLVGDRPDTDVAAAREMGWGVALVLTGVTAASDLVANPWTPDFVLEDVGGLLGDATGL